MIIQEESYTSKSSFLDQDLIPTYQKGVKHYLSCRRIKRGLDQSADGSLINADVNGSLNILRKAIPSAKALGIKEIEVFPKKVKLQKYEMLDVCPHFLQLLTLLILS
ncbi:hypothetical protein [Nodularia sphaerocarpa]|uniref:hypothetical protein n=1 Tax=Nodularia sphaerocarpa TaxID=137816 RepID=UPI001EFA6570|nr:hypothetical protein [Nodularia sphaerocarpa]ULP70819.1 hypothetical protein BDGGKGIB_00440 [Nodularia sphaerocarpa UHCC 0038]